MNIIDIHPIVLRASKFQSTKQTPNSEEIKNQYFYRIMVFVYGSATVVLDNSQIVCNENDILYLLPDTPYRILNSHGDFTVINVYFDYFGKVQIPEELAYKTLFQNRFERALCQERHTFTDFSKLNESHVIHNNADIADFSYKILRRFEKDITLSQRLVSFLMSCIIEEMCLYQENHGRKNERYEQMISYIKENAHLKITAEDLAEKFFYHKNHINRIIKRETGMNFKMFVMKTKIDLADKLLEDTDMNVTEIANYLNFFDASHFIKSYKKLKKTSKLNRWHY